MPIRAVTNPPTAPADLSRPARDRARVRRRVGGRSRAAADRGATPHVDLARHVGDHGLQPGADRDHRRDGPVRATGSPPRRALVAGLGGLRARVARLRARRAACSCSWCGAASRAPAPRCCCARRCRCSRASTVARGSTLQSWAATAAFGAAVGPAVGGILTQLFDWRAIFLAQAPVAALAAVAAIRGGEARAATGRTSPAAERPREDPRPLARARQRVAGARLGGPDRRAVLGHRAADQRLAADARSEPPRCSP